MHFCIKLYVLAVILFYVKYFLFVTARCVITEAVLKEDKSIIMNFKVNTINYNNVTRLTGIREHTVRITVNAPNIRKRCNEEMIRYLSSLLDVQPNQFWLSKGSRSQLKIFYLDNSNYTVEDVIDIFKRELVAHSLDPRKLPSIKLKG